MPTSDFFVTRPIGRGRSPSAFEDIVRLGQAFIETGYQRNSNDPSASRKVGSKAEIKQFQRDWGLEPDGVIMPGGPTEGALDVALKANRSTGVAGQQQTQNVFTALSRTGFSFDPTAEAEGVWGPWRDQRGDAVTWERLRENLGDTDTGLAPRLGDIIERPPAAGAPTRSGGPVIDPMTRISPQFTPGAPLQGRPPSHGSPLYHPPYLSLAGLARALSTNATGVPQLNTPMPGVPGSFAGDPRSSPRVPPLSTAMTPTGGAVTPSPVGTPASPATGLGAIDPVDFDQPGQQNPTSTSGGPVSAGPFDPVDFDGLAPLAPGARDQTETCLSVRLRLWGCMFSICSV